MNTQRKNSVGLCLLSFIILIAGWGGNGCRARRKAKEAEKKAAALKAEQEWNRKLDTGLGVVTLSQDGDPGKSLALTRFVPLNKKAAKATILKLDSAPYRKRVGLLQVNKLWKRDGSALRLGSDGKKLYILAAAYDREPEKIRATATSVTPWEDDSFDFFFRSGSQSFYTYRLSINAAGAWSLTRYSKGMYEADAPGEKCTVPVEVHVRRDFFGYEISASFALRDLVLPELHPQTQFYLGVQRNIRGIGKGGEIWRLIPQNETVADATNNFFAPNAPILNPIIAINSYYSKEPPPRTDLPRTPQPVIAISDNDRDAILAPELRSFSGNKIDDLPETEIRMRADSPHLYITIDAADPDPTKEITQYSKRSPPMPFKDDSVELFFCPGSAAPYYYQVCISCTGVYTYYACRNTWGKKTIVYRPWDPKELKVKVSRHTSGYRVQFQIALADIGLKKAKSGLEFYMQAVRNYRGQWDQGSQLLQLFPNAIYSSQSRMGNNHDRRSFQKVRFGS